METHKQKVIIAKIIKGLEKELSNLNGYLSDNPPKYKKCNKPIDFVDYMNAVIDFLYAQKINYMVLEREKIDSIMKIVFDDTTDA